MTLNVTSNARVLYRTFPMLVEMPRTGVNRTDNEVSARSISQSKVEESSMGVKVKTGGRKAGIPNRSTAELKQAAQQYTQQALATLAWVMANSQSDQARIAAARELLDRAYGKAMQAAEVKAPARIAKASSIPLPLYDAALKKALAEY